MSELEIVERVLSGDREAYAELVRANHSRILALCSSMLSDRMLAEDAAQDVFVKAYQSLHQFKRDSSFSTWLYRIASNHCLDLLRKKARERTDSLDAMVEEHGDRIPTLSPNTAGTDLAALVENSDLVTRALERLPPDYRLILSLREMEGLSYEEISKALSCSLDAVKARLKRARKNLDDILRHILAPENV